MVIKMSVRGDKEKNNFLLNLPKEVTAELDKESMLFTRDVQKSAKLRAPKDTGEMATRIQFLLGKKKGQYIVNVDSPYAYYQEFGFTPHFVPKNTSTKNSKGFTEFGMFVSKFTPFLTPALEFYVAKLNSRLSDAASRGMRKAG
jgi:hypothetical protein